MMTNRFRLFKESDYMKSKIRMFSANIASEQFKF